MTKSSNFWIVLACVVLVLSPFVQGFARGSGFNVAAVGVALFMGGGVLYVYLRMLRRTQRDLDR
jgi:Flp pilus assembly protein TadB